MISINRRIKPFTLARQPLLSFRTQPYITEEEWNERADKFVEKEQEKINEVLSKRQQLIMKAKKKVFVDGI